MTGHGAPVLVDVRGLNCPEPVIRVRSAIESNPGRTLRVVADSADVCDNIARFARKCGYSVLMLDDVPDTYSIELSPGGGSIQKPAVSDRVVMIASEQFGTGSEELGKLLMELFLRSLAEVPAKPATIVLVHGGVKLAVAGSAVLDTLNRLERLGFTIRVCGTCLDYYGLKGETRVGQVSNMYELVEIMTAATDVLRI